MSRSPDHDWFLGVLESHRRLIHKICWAYAGSPQDRDDLFQEIVVRLWSAVGRYDPDRSLSTWLYRVGLNVAIDFHRKRCRRRGETLGLEADRMSGPESDPGEADRLRELRELMDRQSAPDRALLLLYLDGNSHREIGEVLGISESNVGTRLNRITKSLRASVRSDVD